MSGKATLMYTALPLYTSLPLWGIREFLREMREEWLRGLEVDTWYSFCGVRGRDGAGLPSVVVKGIAGLCKFCAGVA